jgi:hypothetical protein
VAATRITNIRMSAPSFKACAIAKLGTPRRGNVPTNRVIVAEDAQGRTWQHFRIFGSHEANIGIALMRKIEAVGAIDTKYWRQTKGEY